MSDQERGINDQNAIEFWASSVQQAREIQFREKLAQQGTQLSAAGTFQEASDILVSTTVLVEDEKQFAEKFPALISAFLESLDQMGVEPPTLDDFRELGPQLEEEIVPAVITTMTGQVVIDGQKDGRQEEDDKEPEVMIDQAVTEALSPYLLTIYSLVKTEKLDAMEAAQEVYKDRDGTPVKKRQTLYSAIHLLNEALGKAGIAEKVEPVHGRKKRFEVGEKNYLVIRKAEPAATTEGTQITEEPTVAGAIDGLIEKARDVLDLGEESQQTYPAGVVTVLDHDEGSEPDKVARTTPEELEAGEKKSRTFGTY